MELASFVNCINTVEGGMHETGFKVAHTRVMNEYARRMGIWKQKGNLTGDDVCQQGRFWDAIGIFPEFVDGYQVLILPTTGRYFQVPLRACIPTKVDNLLVAGRCVLTFFVLHFLESSNIFSISTSNFS